MSLDLITLVMSFSTEKDVYPVQERTSIGQTPSDDHNDKYAPISSHTPSWEEIVELLKQVPYFTKLEPSSTDMNDFFPLTNRFFVKMVGDLHYCHTSSSTRYSRIRHLPHSADDGVHRC